MTRLQPRSPLAMLRRTAAAVCLAWAGAAGLSVAMAQTPPALTLPPVLPPAETVMQVLSQLPQVRVASAGVPLAQARNQRLEAGPHDWVAKAGTNRRTERQGPSFSEADVALETGLRWPAKAAADRQLGATEIQLGELALADAWHEAARGLMAAWFDALRDMRTASVLQDQARLVTQQMASTERRVAAGEAATLEPWLHGRKGNCRCGCRHWSACTRACQNPWTWPPPAAQPGRPPRQPQISRPPSGPPKFWTTTTSWNWHRPKRNRPASRHNAPRWNGMATPP